MAITVIDNFDSYTDGPLTGQGGWTGTDRLVVEGTEVEQGTKAIVRNGDSTGNYGCILSITPRTMGIIGCYLRGTNNSTIAINLNLIEDGFGVRYSIYLNTDGKIWDTNIALQNFSANTWYKVEAEIDQANSRFRARVNGGVWHAWYTQAFTQIDTVSLYVGSVGTGSSGYWDYVFYDSNKPFSPLPSHYNT
jgi:hypothetical protein